MSIFVLIKYNKGNKISMARPRTFNHEAVKSRVNHLAEIEPRSVLLKEIHERVAEEFGITVRSVKSVMYRNNKKTVPQ